MITRFHVENFKSLAKFDLPPAGHRLGPFTCLIGLNGSGKSTLLQAFDFAGHIVSGKVEDWLTQRHWKPSEVATNLGKRTPVVTFEIAFAEAGIEAVWQAATTYTSPAARLRNWSPPGRRCWSADKLSLIGPDGQWKRKEEKLELVYKGSVLSILQLADAHPTLRMVKDSLRQLKSLELLSPHLLRRRSYAAKDIGVGGEKLSAFLAGIGADNQAALLGKLQQFYPQLKECWVKSLRAGWKELRFLEQYQGYYSFQATQINDGMLRIIAILAQANSPYTFLLFDEIENGINPELVEKLVDFLIHCDKQVMVTTHSPMILNYIPDDVAKEGVIMLYKTRQGDTKSARFFDLPAMQEKLRALGPGEVFADTRLSNLAAELERLDNGNSTAAPQP